MTFDEINQKVHELVFEICHKISMIHIRLPQQVVPAWILSSFTIQCELH